MLVPAEYRQPLISGAGAALGIAMMVTLAETSGMHLAAVPFATSIVLVMSAPESPQAQPRNILGGHLMCALAGFAVLWLIGSAPILSALAVGLGVALMVITQTMHPPAGLNGVIIVTLAPSWTFLAVPVLAGALLLIGFAYSYHRLTRSRPWPQRWWGGA